MSALDPLTSQWPSERARFLFREVNDRGYDLPLASVTRDGGVEFRADLDISVWNPSDDISNYKRVMPGDFVIGLRSFQSGLGCSPLEGLVSPAYSVLRSRRSDMDGGYFRHLLKSDILVSRLENIAQGIRQGRTIAVDDFNELQLPLPPLATQRAIADYLDRETSRIDALIAVKRRMAELLEERLRVEISYATTEGCPMAVRRIILLRTTGPRGWADLVADSGEPFIRSANLRRDDIELRDDDIALVNPPVSQEATRSRTRPGDVLVGVTGANTGWIGIVRPQFAHGYVSQHVAILRPAEGLLSEWLAYSLFSNRVQDQLLGSQYGGTKQQLGLEDLANLVISLPDLDRQAAIVARLERAKRDCRSAIAALSTQIELLEERRRALVTAAVTGQLDIPEAA